MLSQVQALLTDSRFDRQTRLVRLAGWRGDSVEEAVRSGWRLRIAPAFCAVASIGLGLLGEPLLLGLLAASAAVGAIRGNHIVEELYNATFGRRGVAIPKARAARLFGCAMGAVVISASAVAFAAGLPALGLTLALTMGAVATFVAVTDICVPSIMFILMFGSSRSTEGSFVRSLAPWSKAPAEARS